MCTKYIVQVKQKGGSPSWRQSAESRALSRRQMRRPVPIRDASRWNTRIIVVPGLPLVRRGPYRLLPHPNYVAVVVEGLALPLVATGWVTALVFSALNAVLLLGFRIPAEERALTAALAAEPAR